MSNPEIEDVLSSIRRLVSEDLRPGLRAPAASEPADKLLLTPALRIVEPLEPAAGAPLADAEPDLAQPRADDSAPSVEDVPVEDVVARLGAAVAEDDWESPFGDPEVWPGTLPAPGSLPPGRARADDEQAAGQFVHRARPAMEGGLPDDFTDAPLAGFGPEAFEPDTFGPDTEVLPDPAPPTGARAPRREVSPPQDDSNWADDAEAEVIAELAQDVEDDVLSDVYGRDDAGMVFDEEVLRDLVRDLIREELSGTLGERITRNVRKLVRAEIARALALREFE